MNALVIIAKDGYQDHEYTGTCEGFAMSNINITIASTQAGECHGKLGGSATADVALKDVRVVDYDKIAFIGGPGAAGLADDEHAQRIAREAVEAGIPLGAICIAPTILAKAGVLKGKKATVWDSGGEQAKLLEQHGATYTGDPVTSDGLIVTANGPDAAKDFGQTIAKA